MADTGWVLVGTGSNIPVSGGANWQRMEGLSVPGNDIAVVGGRPYTAILRSSNFGFSIPSSATITGVGARITASGINTSSANDRSVRLVVNGSATGSDLVTGTAFPRDMEPPPQPPPRDYGGEGSLWGVTSLTPAIVNASNFGFDFQGNVPGTKTALYAYNTWMRIFYTEGGGVYVQDAGIWKEGGAYVNDGGVWKPATKFVNDGGVWKS